MSKQEFYHEQNAHITHANGAYETLIASGQVDVPFLRETAMKLITTEQQAAVDAMNTQYGADLAEVQTITDEQQKRIREITEAMAVYRQADEKTRQQLELLAKFYADANNIAVPDHTSSIEALEAELEQMSQTPVATPDTNPEIFMPWAVPVNQPVNTPELPDFPEYLDWQYPPAQPVEFEGPSVDIYPDDLSTAQRQEVGARVRESFGHTKDAGLMLAYLGGLTLGKTWTRWDIANEIYCDENDRERAAHKAGSLMGNYWHRNGSSVDKGLRQLEKELGVPEGSFSMQIGRRYGVRNDGTPYGKGSRICRVLDLRAASAANKTVTGEYVDDWDIENERREARADSEALVGSAAVQAAVPRESEPLENSGQGDHEDHIVIIENDTQPADEPIAEEPDIEEAPVDAKESEQTWQDAFEVSVREWLSTAIEQGLTITADDVQRNVLRKLGSKRLGTEESFKRAFRANIIDRNTMTDRKAQLKLEVVVAMALQNSNPGIFNEPRKHAEAMVIIETILGEMREAAKLEKAV